MELQTIGAAREVTGSMHVLRTEAGSILLDCGLYQGRRQEALERNRSRPAAPRELDAVVLSHAHIDHSGALPLLVKRGYRGPIYATPATHDLCAVMLEDAAMVQAQDSAYLKRLAERGEIRGENLEPLYTQQDVARVLSQMVPLPYGQRQRLLPDTELEFFDAGHVLGSALCALDVDEQGQSRRLLYTGDLGRAARPILRDPQIPPRVHALLCESTYGGRQHPAGDTLDERLSEAITRTHARGGKVIIPSFALERAQEIIYAIKRLLADKRIPSMPVYVDSPLTNRITGVFRLHPECYDKSTRQLLEGSESPFEFKELTYVDDVEASKDIDRSNQPCIIIAASGMCEFGRVVHHLRAEVENHKSTVVIVGFQAQHTLGRRLVERRQKVPIFGVKRPRRCEVVVLNGFSAHADHDELIDFMEAVRDAGPLRTVVLVHGEEPAQSALEDDLQQRGFPDVRIPGPAEKLRI